MQPIELDLDRENELVFKLSIEGTRPATTRSRFLLESGGFSLVFEAKSLPEGEVSVMIPTLENIISEGIHRGKLEVIVDDKIVFTPIQVDTEFKKSINIVAEVVSSRSSGTNIVASPVVSVNRKRVEVTESDKAKTLEPVETSGNVHEERENISETVEAKQPEPLKERKRPEQRSRRRPTKMSRSRELSSARMLESKIRSIADKKNIEISARQVEKIANIISEKGGKK